MSAVLCSWRRPYMTIWRLSVLGLIVALSACGKPGDQSASARVPGRGPLHVEEQALETQQARTRPSPATPDLTREPHIARLADYPWLTDDTKDTVESRIHPPASFSRARLSKGSFGEWLRGLPLRPGRPPVHLYDGRLKGSQSAHHAVVDIDVGRKDLQQCADAVIRLRAEYLYSRGLEKAIAFHFTSGDVAEWRRWRGGERPRVRGNEVSWSKIAEPDASHKNFRKYLDVVFTYAGSASLSKELESVRDPAAVEVGNVFIRGGFPGHAVLVVDVAMNAAGERVFLLAQSYMPAQQIHVLRNLRSPLSPWYRAAARGALKTPEWAFRYEDLKRFPRVGDVERER